MRRLGCQSAARQSAPGRAERGSSWSLSYWAALALRPPLAASPAAAAAAAAGRLSGLARSPERSWASRKVLPSVQLDAPPAFVHPPAHRLRSEQGIRRSRPRLRRGPTEVKDARVPRPARKMVRGGSRRRGRGSPGLLQLLYPETSPLSLESFWRSASARQGRAALATLRRQRAPSAAHSGEPGRNFARSHSAFPS